MVFILVRTLNLAWLALLLGCTFSSDENYSKVERALQSIPNEHRQRLEAMFTRLARSSDAAFTLFGPKPCSVQSYFEKPTSSYPLYNAGHDLMLSEGWESWQRYGHLFPSQSFQLRKIPLSDFPFCSYLVIVNNPATLAIIRSHCALFQKALNTEQSAEELWSQMQSSDAFLEKIIDSEVLGILLGYGQKNTHAFHRRAEIGIHLNQCAFPPFLPSLEMEALGQEGKFMVSIYKYNARKQARIGKVLPSSGYATLAEEMNAICSKAGPALGDELLIEQFIRPQFNHLKDDPEGLEWSRAYDKTRKELSYALKGKPLLETILVQWTSGVPKT